MLVFMENICLMALLLLFRRGSVFLAGSMVRRRKYQRPKSAPRGRASYMIIQKTPRVDARGVFYYLITSLIILYALGFVLVNFTALANRAKPSSKRFLSDAYRVATTSPFLTASPHFLCSHKPAP